MENQDVRCRERIVNAAIECFALHGFHGASVARIGRKAGASPGHIYYYFENKEALVKAIVAKELERRFLIIAKVRSTEKGLKSLLSQTKDAVTEYCSAKNAKLWIEIFAEAARNESVARIIAEADAASRKELEALFRDLRAQLGLKNSNSEITASVEVFMAIFDGLMNRSIRYPEIDADAVGMQVILAVRGLFETAEILCEKA